MSGPITFFPSHTPLTCPDCGAPYADPEMVYATYAGWLDAHRKIKH